MPAKLPEMWYDQEGNPRQSTKPLSQLSRHLIAGPLKGQCPWQGGEGQDSGNGNEAILCTPSFALTLSPQSKSKMRLGTFQKVFTANENCFLAPFPAAFPCGSLRLSSSSSISKIISTCHRGRRGRQTLENNGCCKCWSRLQPQQ